MAPADQLVLAAEVTDARFATRTACLRAGPRRRATNLAVDAALVPGAAVPTARAFGRAAGAFQAELGACATHATTERHGTGAGAKDANPVASAPTTVGVDPAAIRATGTTVAVGYALGRGLLDWFFGLLLFLLLAPGGDVSAVENTQASTDGCCEANNNAAPGAHVSQDTRQVVELQVIHPEASRPSISRQRDPS